VAHGREELVGVEQPLFEQEVGQALVLLALELAYALELLGSEPR
jgi:hypothetical protein